MVEVDLEAGQFIPSHDEWLTLGYDEPSPRWRWPIRAAWALLALCQERRNDSQTALLDPAVMAQQERVLLGLEVSVFKYAGDVVIGAEAWLREAS